MLACPLFKVRKKQRVKFGTVGFQKKLVVQTEYCVVNTY